MWEAHRVLNPGGRFYFQFMNLLSEGGFRDFQQTVQQDYRGVPLHLYTPEEVGYLLGQAGLHVDQLCTEGDYICAIGRRPAGQR